jgi:hypothetical protein
MCWAFRAGGHPSETEQPRQFHPGRRRTHEGFTDEDGMHGMLIHQGDVGSVEDAGFNDDDSDELRQWVVERQQSEVGIK